MSMLAEPRRKQRVINLRAKNNAWSNDTNKFGQRMLEKMGWSAGKGLGANENGIVEHVIARYKNDDKGLGFEDKNDQWTKHEDDFNALLANLSNGDDNKEEKLHSGVSLEKKSKKSKARVHYHKFTRGKDLTRYSEKDLANIFGKKSFKEEKTEELVKEDLKQTEQIFTEKGSMEDYFKNKLAAFKLKNKITPLVHNENEEDNAECAFKGFSMTSTENNDNQGLQTFSFYGTSNINLKQEHINETDNVEINIEVKKKKKKSKDIEVETVVCDSEIVFKCKTKNIGSDNSEPSLENIKVKKSKKKRHHLEMNNCDQEGNGSENYSTQISISSNILNQMV
ncbi:PIN2/TERF1-interacting telomerase inhibitor 1 [Aphomia sociella]